MCLCLPPSSVLAPICQTVTGATATGPPSTRQPLAHLCSCFLHAFFSFSTQLIDSAFTGGGNVFTGRGLKLKPGWLRAQFMHLEYRYPGLLDECVHLLSVGCVCRHHAAPSQVYQCQPLCNNYNQLCRPCKANFPSRHPILSVVLVRLSRLLSQVSCKTTRLLQGWETMLPHNLHRLDQRVCEVV